MRWYTLIVLVLINSSRGSHNGTSKVVIVAQGTVRGYRNPVIGIFEFYGIPYATVPTGEHRFQAPLPPSKWESTFEAVDRGIICPQGISPDIDLKNKTMKEDCLIANVFVPDTDKQNLPVLVTIHGGGFQVGYGNLKKFTTLVRTKNIIVVNFNYRLGILGYLCLGTEDVPGNAGMKDQVALLKWVNQNIATFGGDPNMVTVSGWSTGAASTELLVHSTMTKGLFNKVIISSGSSINVFAVQLNPLENARYYARKLKLRNPNDIHILEKMFKAASLKHLTLDIFDNIKDSTVVFAPCVERINTTQNFLNDAPYNIFMKHEHRNIPTMYSFDNMEGLMKFSKFNVWIKNMEDNFSDFIPAELQFNNEKERESVARVIKDFYFKDKNNRTLEYVNYFTDIVFLNGIFKSIGLRIEAGHDKIYLQDYSFVDQNTPVVPNTTIRGANHCAQVIAVADEDENMLTEEYKRVKQTMRELWANFITTGEPTPKGSQLPHWPAMNNKIGPVMSLASTLEVKDALDLSLQQHFKFWNGIYENHYRVVSPPG